MGFAGAEANILADLSHWGQATHLSPPCPIIALVKKLLMFLNQNGVVPKTFLWIREEWGPII